MAHLFTDLLCADAAVAYGARERALRMWCWLTNLSQPPGRLFLLLAVICCWSIPAQAQVTVDGQSGDWTWIAPGSGQPVPAGVSVYSFKADGFNGVNEETFSSAKDYEDPSDWLWTTNGANDKTDIEHGAAFVAGTRLYFAADRYAQNGDAAIGIWFLKSPVAAVAGGTFTGHHQVGDLLIVSQFNNGGSNPTIEVYEWVGTGGNVNGTGGTLKLITASNAAARVNGADITPSPWAFTPKFGSAGTIPAGGFFEGYVDFDGLSGLDLCFTTFMFETSQSQEVTDALSDFMLGQFATKPLVAVNSPTVCRGDAATFTATIQSGTGIPPFEFSWNGGSSWSVPSASLTNTFTTSNATAQVLVRGSNGCVSDPATGTRVTNSVTGGAVAGGGTQCAPADAAAFTSLEDGSGTGDITYQWQSSTTSAVAGFTDISGATDPTYDPAAVTLRTWFRRVATSTLNQVACSANSNTLEVRPNSVDAGTVAGGGTLCSPFNPAAFSNSATGSGTGDITYQWQSSTTSAVAGFTDISGATDPIYDAPAVSVPTWFRRVATSTLNSVACAAASNVLLVKPNNVKPGEIAGSSTICSGGDPAAFTSTNDGSGSGDLTYQWQRKAPGDLDWSNIPLATVAAYDVPGPVTADGVQYRRIVTSTLDGQPCAAASNVLQITVNVCGGKVCTLTQGGWSNDQGILCSRPTLRRLALINDLLSTGNLTIGLPTSVHAAARSITFTPGQGQCIIDRMPGGGGAAALPTGMAYTVNSTTPCSAMPTSVLKNGKFNNVLIGQTLALSLNARLDSHLGDVVLAASMTTYNTINCTDVGTMPTALTRTIPQSVLTNLGSGATVTQLLALANRALSGLAYTANGATPSLADISNAAGAINELFDNCRVIATTFAERTAMGGASTAGEALVGAYPNPAAGDVTVEFVVTKPGKVTVQVFNSMGLRVATLYAGEAEADRAYRVHLATHNLPNGTYYYQVRTANGRVATGRVALLK